MKFYLSGLRGKRELDWAKFGQHVLLDPFQARNVPDNYPVKDRLMDSGAYWCLKHKAYLSIAEYLDAARSYPWASIIAPDVIGDKDATYQNWLAMKIHAPDLFDRVIPVWHWQTAYDYDLLDRYLEEAAVVGIGGLVDPLRKKRDSDDPKASEQARDRVLRELVHLCEKYPGRFHIFGLCWPKAITALNKLVISADSSLWLWGAKHGDLLSIRQSTTGTPFLTSGKWYYDDRYRGVDWESIWDSKAIRARELCIENIRTLRDFCKPIDESEH